MSKTFPLLFVLFVLSFELAFSHDVWLQPEGGALIVACGHSEKLDPYDPKFVKQPRGFDCTGGTVPVGIQAKNKGVSLTTKGNPATVTIFFDGGYWVKTTDGWKNLTKREAQGKYTVVQGWKSRLYAKHLATQCDTFAQPTGLAFEIVPEKDPFAVKAGEELPIKVLLDGKAFEGAVIRSCAVGHSEPEGAQKTDKNGKASFLIEKPGFQKINASYRAPLKDDPDADMLSLATSLTFELK